MRGKRSFLWTFLALSLVLCLGVTSKTQLVYASEENKASTLSVIDEHRSWVKDFKTPLHDGDAFETIRFELAPLVKDLATGTVSNDELCWEFEDAFLYTENYSASLAETKLKNRLYLIQPDFLPSLLCEAIIGIYDLGELYYKTETRYTSDIYGNAIYRCAITGISVKSWCSPYGDICSREEALGYYNKCQERIEFVVSKVISARQSNGEPLTNEQKLKWIHDWLIISVDYAYEKLNLHETDREKYKFRHLWNEYGAIMDGETVCQGYSYAFKAIADELVKQTGADIECEEAIDNNKLHSWIRVKINQKWYHIDMTYDETGFPLRGIPDDLFLVNDRKLDYEDHEGGDEEGGYYSINSSTKATSSKYESKFWGTYKKDLSEYTVVVKDPKALRSYGSDISSAIEVKYGVNALPLKAYSVVRIHKIVNGMLVNVLIVVPSKECETLKGSVEVPGSVVPTPCFAFLNKNRQ